MLAEETRNHWKEKFYRSAPGDTVPLYVAARKVLARTVFQREGLPLIERDFAQRTSQYPCLTMRLAHSVDVVVVIEMMGLINVDTEDQRKAQDYRTLSRRDWPHKPFAIGRAEWPLVNGNVQLDAAVREPRASL